MKSRFVLESGGFALLLVLPFVFPLLVPGSLDLFHHRFTFANPLTGILLNIGFFFVVGIVTCLATSRLPQFPRSLASGFLVGLVLWWMLFAASTLANSLPIVEDMAQATGAKLELFWIIRRSQGKILPFNSIIPMFFVGLAFIKPGIISLLAKQVRFALASFSFCALWIVPQIGYIAFHLQPVPSSFDRSMASAKTDSNRRIIWVLFDELSYKLAIEDTPPNLALPNLHRLALQSSTFANIQPIGFFTDRITLSLLSGKQIVELKGGSNGNPLYRTPNHHQWQIYDPRQSLFGIAQESGLNAGLAGWFNPYCRIFESVLASCLWRTNIFAFTPFERLGSSSRTSVLENALVVPRFFAYLFTGLGEPPAIDLLGRDQRDLQLLTDESVRLIRNSQIQFVYMHLPVPHPPGLYDREKHAFCHCGNYLDNLVLTDDTLGLLMHEIDQSPLAKETTLIVSSDHSWRVNSYSKSGGWTPEEEAVSKGVYETRPVFLVHFPGQTAGTKIMTPISELREHDVIASMLRGKVNSPEALNAVMTQETETATSR
jgi:hypothetical protein